MSSLTTFASLAAVHPRTCGEHGTVGMVASHFNGSSPHVRGTFVSFGHGAVSFRFIPARAGNMSPSRMTIPTSPVHPRTCGEHKLLPVFRQRGHGSSPHVRGTSHAPRSGWSWDRFIPARAGNIPSFLKRKGIIYGSSPHVRGTSNRVEGRLVEGRFIPARAGNILLTTYRFIWQKLRRKILPIVLLDYTPMMGEILAGFSSS